MTELTNELKNTPRARAPQGLRQAVMRRMEFHPVQAIQRGWPYQTTPVTVALLLLGVLVFGAATFPVFQKARRSAGFDQRTLSARGTLKEVGQGLKVYPHGAPGSASMPTAAEPLASPKPAPARPVAEFKRRDQVSDAKGEPAYFGFDNASVPASQPASAANLMIIKTADLSVRVKDFDLAYNQAVSIAKSTGGYVTDSAAQNDGAAPTSGNLTMRVPVNAFERTLERLGKLGKITSKSISGEDVTGEVVDLEARLRNKRAEERQYLEIMNRAKRVPDIVTVTNELSRVRGEIEEAQGRMKYLKSSVAMSTINLTLSEKEKPAPVKSSIERTWGSAIGALAGAGNRLMALGIWLAVFSPFWALPLGGWVYAKKRAERSSAACSGEPVS